MLFSTLFYVEEKFKIVMLNRDVFLYKGTQLHYDISIDSRNTLDEQVNLREGHL